MEEYDEEVIEVARTQWEATEPHEIIQRFKVKGKIAEKDILGMKPGRELNIVVAKYVMGNDVVSDTTFGDMEALRDHDGNAFWDFLSPYSEDRSAAELVVTTMVQLGHGDAVFWEHFGNGIYTQSEAICKRALLVITEKGT